MADALASAKSMGAVAAGLSQLWEAVHLHCPLPQATLSKWPPDSLVHQSRATIPLHQQRCFPCGLDHSRRAQVTHCWLISV